MFSWLKPKRVPLIVAHRGASTLAPENTLAAFHRAIADGADAIEIDIHLSLDGEIVIIHDDTLNRTTDGKGEVGKHTLEEIRDLSAGRWFHWQYAGERIPMLGEVLRLCGENVGVNIEVKMKPSQVRRYEIIDRCYKIIRGHNARKRVLVSSFHHDYLHHLRTLDAEIAIGVLYHPLRHKLRPPSGLAVALGAQYLILSGASVKSGVISRARQRGLRIGEYTVNTSQRLKRALAMNIDAVYTDAPREIASFLANG